MLATTSLVVACSSTKTEYVDGGPAASGTYTLKFPSTAAAVATDTVQIYVFPGGDGGQSCFALVQKEQSHQALPPASQSTAPITPCDLEAGTGALTIPFGSVAVLAVAQRKNADFLIGCAEKTLSAADPSVSVDLSLAGTGVAVPPTVCTDLSPHCKGSCN